jgi:hypothetical protein
VLGLLSAAAALLASAGAFKLLRGGTVRSALNAARLPGADRLSERFAGRLAGLAELLVAFAAVVLGGRLAAGLLATAFAVLALVSIRMMAVAAGQDCGCFAGPSGITHWHTGVNVAYAVACLLGVLAPSPSLLRELTDHPWTGSALTLSALLLAFLSYLLMTALPELLSAASRVEVVR